MLTSIPDGGYGDPLDRPAEKVEDDVVDLKVSLEAAREVYGVVIEDGRLHPGESLRLRKRLRRHRSRPADPGEVPASAGA